MTAAEAPAADEPRSSVRPTLLGGLHLAVLSAFALAQPLFDLLSKNAEFFAARGSSRWDIVVFAVGLVVVPPLILTLIELLVGRFSEPARRWLHLVFIALLVALFAIQALKDGGFISTLTLIGGALLIGALVALVYAKAEPVRQILSVLSPAPLLFLLLFLFFSDVSDLVTKGEAEASNAAVASKTPIVMVVFDEFPITSIQNARGAIDRERYPNFAALQRDSVWFRNNTGMHDQTTSAVPTIVDGNYPKQGLLPTARDHPDNLFTILGKSYRMNVLEEATTLCPSSVCKVARGGGFLDRQSSLVSDMTLVYEHVVAPPDIQKNLPSVSENWGDFAKGPNADTGGENADDLGKGAGGPRGKSVKAKLGSGRPARVEEFIDAIEPGGSKPSLNFMHVLLPHVPYQYLPGGQAYRRKAGETIPGMNSPPGFGVPFLVKQSYQRHLLQTGFTDYMVGRMIQRLKDTGMYEKSLVVMVADHGVAFRDGENRRKLTSKNVEQLAAVPLFMKLPGGRQAGEVVDRHVQNIDVLPTIADVLDVKLPSKTDGRSAFDPTLDRPVVEMFQRGGRKLSVPIAEFRRRERAALARKIELFGDGPIERLFAYGPRPELIGRPGRAGAPAGAVKATVNGAGDLAKVDPSSDFLPSHVTGRLTGGRAGDTRQVAVAVNGVIRGTGETFYLAGSKEESLSVMVPWSALRAGANRVDVFEITGSGRAARLVPLGSAG